MEGIWLLLGTNLGNRKKNLEKAFRLLSQGAVQLLEYSSVYESEPWGVDNQPWFWNVVIKVQTALEPAKLLTCCLEVENKMGRIRKQKWGERLVDIDILYYENQIINEPNLEIPHPRIQERKFVLIPLVEKGSDLIHPILEKSQSDLLSELESSLVCSKTHIVLSP